MTNVLVTGATGFIGQWLCAELTAAGHDVQALMRRPEQLESLRQECERRGGNGSLIRAVSGDLDAPGLGLAADPLVDIVFHLGARFAWNLSVAEARSTNVQGGLAVADLASRVGARLVIVGGFMSQNHAYLEELSIDGLNPSRTNWKRVYSRTGAYEASKLESFFTMAERAESLAVPWIGVHPAGLCGHSRTGDIAGGQPFVELIDGIRNGHMTAIPGGREHWLPLVTVDHLAQLMAALVDHPWPAGRSLVALDPETPDLAGLVTLIAKTLDVRAPHRRVPLRLLQALLRIPGAERLAHTSRESLSFLRTERLDVSSTQAFATSAGVTAPPIHAAIERTVEQLTGVTQKTL